MVYYCSAPTALFYSTLDKQARHKNTTIKNITIMMQRFIEPCGFRSPLYSGLEPQFVELDVREDNRKATKTFTVRSKLPQDSPLDPGLHGDFTGTFENVRNQVFSLVTNDGAKGKIELLPGPAKCSRRISFW